MTGTIRALRARLRRFLKREEEEAARAVIRARPLRRLKQVRRGELAERSGQDAIRRAFASVRERAWKRENAQAIASMNEWVEKNGLPLARYRQF